jgi:hypothetical protein
MHPVTCASEPAPAACTQHLHAAAITLRTSRSGPAEHSRAEDLP